VINDDDDDDDDDTRTDIRRPLWRLCAAQSAES